MGGAAHQTSVLQAGGGQQRRRHPPQEDRLAQEADLNWLRCSFHHPFSLLGCVYRHYYAQ